MIAEQEAERQRRMLEQQLLLENERSMRQASIETARRLANDEQDRRNLLRSDSGRIELTSRFVSQRSAMSMAVREQKRRLRDVHVGCVLERSFRLSSQRLATRLAEAERQERLRDDSERKQVSRYVADLFKLECEGGRYWVAPATTQNK